MLPGKAEILARYAKKETVADKFGRLITVGRLKFSETLAVRRMAETEDAPALAYMSVAASVRAVDDIPYPFPRNLQDLNGTIDALDEEGMAAAMEAMVKLRGETEAVDADPKSSAPTQISANSAS